MSAESIRIINAAISRTKNNPITSLNDGTDEAQLMSQNYEQVVNTALEQAPFRFARKVGPCTHLPDAPLDLKYTDKWELPDDLLMLRALMVQGIGYTIDYVIDEFGVVLTNYPKDVSAIYTFRAPEAQWPFDFKEGITCRLEAMFLRADDDARADARDQRADQLLRRAALSHAQEERPHDPKRAPLVEARRIGRAQVRR